MSTETAYFRTPEVVAPELGMTPTELRRYCRASEKHHTRLSNNRIMLDQDNIDAIIAFVKEQKEKPVIDPVTGDEDPFA
ncbi:hypothetical protein CIK76_05090 [Glutamicibacter sp. BW80]|uniref:hypothetical protein n=1 Tax=unclassified Glutamicibacter TaxID=2627139 RepID=UPI000BB90252|nr:hypothetical protein [Glutamicibacter sp. BW80]PCC29769.1 hypothetical protein CIK76_05090 [Glutamicibacter sp. BW80]